MLLWHVASILSDLILPQVREKLSLIASAYFTAVQWIKNKLIFYPQVILKIHKILLKEIY